MHGLLKKSRLGLLRPTTWPWELEIGAFQHWVAEMQQELQAEKDQLPQTRNQAWEFHIPCTKRGCMIVHLASLAWSTVNISLRALGKIFILFFLMKRRRYSVAQTRQKRRRYSLKQQNPVAFTNGAELPNPPKTKPKSPKNCHGADSTMKSTPPTQTLNHRVLVTPDQTHNLLVTDEPPSRYYIAPQLRQCPLRQYHRHRRVPPSPPPKNCSPNALPTPPLLSLPAYLGGKKTWGSGMLTTAGQPRRLPEPPT